MWRGVLAVWVALAGGPQGALAQSTVLVIPDTVSGSGVSPTYLGGGGAYQPAASGSADIRFEAPQTMSPATQPSFDGHFEAAAWGTNGQQLCVVSTYQGGVQVLVDPYVYVDPSWEFASWFTVETTDDDGATWQAVQRTDFDLSAFGIEDGPVDPGDAGVGMPDSGVPDGGSN